MTASYQKTFPVSWEELHRTAKALAWRLIGQGPSEGQWNGIVAITRGGLVPAAIIARQLDIRLIDARLGFAGISQTLSSGARTR